MSIGAESFTGCVTAPWAGIGAPANASISRTLLMPVPVDVTGLLGAGSAIAEAAGSGVHSGSPISGGVMLGVATSGVSANEETLSNSSLQRRGSSPASNDTGAPASGSSSTLSAGGGH